MCIRDRSAARRGFLKQAGVWNNQEVTIVGSRIIVLLNGSLILDSDLSQIDSYMAGKKHPGLSRIRGHFGFAGHNDPVAFRNIRIK